MFAFTSANSLLERAAGKNWLARAGAREMLEAVLHDLSAQPMALHVEQSGGVGLIAARVLQNSGDEKAFRIGQPRNWLVFSRRRAERAFNHNGFGRLPDFIRQMNDVNCAIRAVEERPFDRVSQFPHVAGPIVAEKCISSRRR